MLNLADLPLSKEDIQRSVCHVLSPVCLWLRQQREQVSDLMRFFDGFQERSHPPADGESQIRSSIDPCPSATLRLVASPSARNAESYQDKQT